MGNGGVKMCTTSGSAPTKVGEGGHLIVQAFEVQSMRLVQLPICLSLATFIYCSHRDMLSYGLSAIHI